MVVKIASTHKFILFALGAWYSEINERLKDKSIKASLSKPEFIKLLRKSKVVKKQERTLYKNLEFLESKKLISYKDNTLKLTKKGKTAFKKLEKELAPYLAAINIVKTAPLKHLKTQTKLV